MFASVGKNGFHSGVAAAELLSNAATVFVAFKVSVGKNGLYSGVTVVLLTNSAVGLVAFNASVGKNGFHSGEIDSIPTAGFVRFTTIVVGAESGVNRPLPYVPFIAVTFVGVTWAVAFVGDVSAGGMSDATSTGAVVLATSFAAVTADDGSATTLAFDCTGSSGIGG